jgi:NTP pyrophosphatase (non-canonical NTP hydrolase)
MSKRADQFGVFMAMGDESSEAVYEIVARIDAANKRYGPFASTHEALGVASEEWDELRDAVRSNDLVAVRGECFDLAAALIRMALAVDQQAFVARSSK